MSLPPSLFKEGEDSHLGAEKESYNSEETEQFLVGKVCGESLPFTFISGFFLSPNRSSKNGPHPIHHQTAGKHKSLRPSLSPNAPTT